MFQIISIGSDWESIFSISRLDHHSTHDRIPGFYYHPLTNTIRINFKNCDMTSNFYLDVPYQWMVNTETAVSLEYVREHELAYLYLNGTLLSPSQVQVDFCVPSSQVCQGINARLLVSAAVAEDEPCCLPVDGQIREFRFEDNFSGHTLGGLTISELENLGSLDQCVGQNLNTSPINLLDQNSTLSTTILLNSTATTTSSTNLRTSNYTECSCVNFQAGTITSPLNYFTEKQIGQNQLSHYTTLQDNFTISFNIRDHEIYPDPTKYSTILHIINPEVPGTRLPIIMFNPNNFTLHVKFTECDRGQADDAMHLGPNSIGSGLKSGKNFHLRLNIFRELNQMDIYINNTLKNTFHKTSFLPCSNGTFPVYIGGPLIPAIGKVSNIYTGPHKIYLRPGNVYTNFEFQGDGYEIYFNLHNVYAKSISDKIDKISLIQIYNSNDPDKKSRLRSRYFALRQDNSTFDWRVIFTPCNPLDSNGTGISENIEFVHPDWLDGEDHTFYARVWPAYQMVEITIDNVTEYHGLSFAPCHQGTYQVIVSVWS